MTFSQFFAILRARWLAALVTFLLVIGLAIGLSLVLPKQYTATASVLVDVRPDPVASLTFPSMVQPAIMATQVDVITSERVARRVVRMLKLTENPAVRQQWQEEADGVGDIESWLADLFSRKLDVKPSRESNVVTITYKAPDPNFASGIANAFVQAYLDTLLELRVNPARQYSNFFDQRAKEARETLEKAQTRLSAFQREKGIIATEERLDVESQRLNELTSQLVMLQAVSAESGSRQAAAGGPSADRMQEVLNNPLVSGLKADLARAEARLQELNSKFGDNHPQVVEAKANIGSLRTKLDTEVKRVTGGVGVTNTINKQREAQVKSELEQQRAKVLRMKAARDEGAVLVRDVDNAQRTYDAVLTRLTQSSLESQSTQTNVNVLTPAAPPVEPSFPKLIINTIVGIVLGLLFAVAVVIVREMLDRRIRKAEDVKDVLGLPLLGVLPKSNAGRRSGRRMQLLAQQRVLGRLPAPKGNA